MKNTIQELKEIVSAYTQKISAISDAEFSAKALPNKWSKKEVLGHLVDSAQNNLRRFICSQYESTPSHIMHDQDFWVKANGYAQASKDDVIKLWRLSNDQIGRILEAVPAPDYQRTSDTGKEAPQLRTIEWLAKDYVKHMKHHLNQIIPKAFDITYP